MGNIFTLDSMREEIEREFSPCQFDLPDGKSVILRNLLRVPKNNREEVYKLLDEMTAANSGEDGNRLSSTEASAQIVLKIIPLVADSRKRGEELVELIEEDLALTLRVFSAWMEATQAGEAEDSQS